MCVQDRLLFCFVINSIRNNVLALFKKRKEKKKNSVSPVLFAR